MLRYIIMAIITIIAIILYILKGIVIVKRQEAMVIERYGQFSRILRDGIHWYAPFIESPRQMYKLEQKKERDGHTYSVLTYSPHIDLSETVYNFSIKNIKTNDDVSIDISIILHAQIIDIKKASYKIENLPEAIEKLTQINLNNLIGHLTFDELFESRDIFNTKLRKIIGSASEHWGVTINYLEVKDIVLSLYLVKEHQY